MVNASIDDRTLAESMGLDAEDVRRRKDFLEFGAQDIALLNDLHQRLDLDGAAFADAFYARLQADAEAGKLLQDAGQLASLKQKQLTYFEQLGSGEYGLEYALARMRVGMAHQAAGLKPKWHLGDYGRYLASILPEMLRHCGGDQQKLLATMSALIKRTLLDSQISLDAYFQSEHELLRLLSQAFESNIEAVFIADMKGKVLHANRTVIEICGFLPEELAGKPWQHLFADQQSEALAAIRQTVANGGRWQGEAWLCHKSGKEFPAWINVSSVKDDNDAVTHFIVEFSDITAFKRTQQELAERTEELAHSNRELEQFAYVASHDLQEPLRMVASYTQLLARRYKDKLDADANEFIHFAVDGATRMQALIIDLLTLSRVGTHGKPIELCESGVALDRAIANLRLAAEESGAVVTRDPMPKLTADISQLTQLFQNLIGNAIKFRGETSPVVHVGAEKRDGEWLLSVRDNGIGIAPEFFERIFVIFQRLHGKHEYPGTGIGLSVCKKIVERHGGKIWIESEPGKGTVFYFTLPVNHGERRRHGE
ncbi:MAG TPA: ATP-binding protein [Novimethylophilus sp.]|uniref:sensor histidine kinase n=1 Tax=Novimethylophilus sp. TaxID=2137426 RepID=UPI002F3FCCD7